MAASEMTSQVPVSRYRSARRKRPRLVAMLQPRLTPMIDVTFQLLLFFLLTMQFRHEGQMPADLPAQREAVVASIPLEPIWIHLRPSPSADGAVQIDIQQYHLTMASWPQLHAQLVDLRTRLGDDRIPVVIEPHQGVSWADALNAFNEARRAEFRDIAFAPMPDESTP